MKIQPIPDHQRQQEIYADVLRRYAWLWYDAAGGVDFDKLAEIVVMMNNGEFNGAQRFTRRR